MQKSNSRFVDSAALTLELLIDDKRSCGAAAGGRNDASFVPVMQPHPTSGGDNTRDYCCLSGPSSRQRRSSCASLCMPLSKSSSLALA